MVGTDSDDDFPTEANSSVIVSNTPIDLRLTLMKMKISVKA